MGGLFSGLLDSLGSMFGGGSGPGSAAGAMSQGVGGDYAAQGVDPSAWGGVDKASLSNPYIGQQPGASGPQPSLMGAAANKFASGAGGPKGAVSNRSFGMMELRNPDMSTPDPMTGLMSQLTQMAAQQQHKGPDWAVPTQYGGNSYVNSMLMRMMGGQ